MLMELADKFGETSPVFKSYYETLKVADKAMAGIYGEVGKAGHEGAMPALQAFNAKVKEVQKRDNSSEHIAVAKVMDENPELYYEYEKQQRQAAVRI